MLEKVKWFGYGAELPENVRQILIDFDKDQTSKRTKKDNVKLVMQGLVGIWLIIALAMHLAAVGLIGLSVIILADIIHRCH